MKRVWHVSSNRWNSAITEYALSSARACLAAGYDVVFSPLKDSPAEQRAKDLGLEILPLPGFGIFNIFQFSRLTKKIKPEIVIVYGGQETTLAALCIPQRTKLIRFRGIALDVSKFAERWRQRLALWRVHLVVTPSTILKATMTSFSRNVEAIELGCDTERFFWRDYDSFKTSSRPEILIFGRLDPVKGHKEFLAFFAALLKEWPDHPCQEHKGDFSWRPLLHICGLEANVSESDLRTAAADLGLIDGEDFKLSIKRIENPALLMAQSLCGVVPSLGSEIIARVTEEFLLCGAAVVVPKVGALQEVVAGDSFGLVLDSLQPTEENIDGAIRFLFASRNEGIEDRRRRAESAKRFFSLAAMSEKWVKVLG